MTTVPTFAPPDVVMARRPDGTIVLGSRVPPAPWEESVPVVLREHAAAHPDRPLAAQRDGQDRWVPLTYGEARARADALAQSFLELGLGPDRPLLVLSGNSLEHLVVTLGAYTAGVPVVPISVAYSLMSADHARIRAIAELVDPGLVFVEDAGTVRRGARRRSRATSARRWLRAATVAGALRLDDLLATSPSAALDDAVAAVGPDTVAKLLFTSGSTATPKGVVNTHRMLCSNQAVLRQIWPFLATEPPVLVDWLPWSHTFGANHNLNLALFNGGTIHIDDGKPAPAAVCAHAGGAAGHRADRLLQRARRVRAARARARARPRAGQAVLQPAAVHVLRRGGAARGARGPPARARRPGGRPRRAADFELGDDRDRAGGHERALRRRRDRVHRRADPRARP